MALTDPQILDFRGDIDDVTSPYTFSDDELNRFYERASSNYEQAVAYAFRQLLSHHAKFNDYTQNATQEKREQVFKHLERMVGYWEAQADKTQTQFKIVGTKTVPPRYKSRPGTERNRYDRRRKRGKY